MKTTKFLLPMLISAAAVSFAPALVADDLTWAGTDGSNTWDTTSTNWTNADGSVSFNENDNVTFTADAANKTVNFDNGANLTAGTVAVSGGSYTFSVGSGSTATLGGSTLTVAQGATLTVGTSDGNTDGRGLSLGFDTVSVAGTLNYNNNADSWSALELDGATLHFEDTNGSGLTIGGTTTVTSDSTITANWNMTFSMGTLAGSGNLSVSGSTIQETVINIASLGDYSGTLSLANPSSSSMSVTIRDSGSSGTASLNVGSGVTVNFNKAGTTHVKDITLEGDATLNVGTWSGSLSYEKLTLKAGSTVNLVNGNNTGGSSLGNSNSQIILDAAGGTATFNGSSWGDNTTVNGTISGAGTLKLGSNGGNRWTVAAEISGDIALLVEQASAQTVTVNGTNTYTGGTTISSGTLAVGNNSALGSGGVTINGGTLSINSGVTLNATTIEIVLDSENLSSAAITGSGTLADGTKISLSLDEALASQIAADGTSIQVLSDTLAGNSSGSITEDSFSFSDSSLGSLYELNYASASGVLTLSVIPEPSAFGLLAGLGALALVASRRRRSRKAA